MWRCNEDEGHLKLCAGDQEKGGVLLRHLRGKGCEVRGGQER